MATIEMTPEMLALAKQLETKPTPKRKSTRRSPREIRNANWRAQLPEKGSRITTVVLTRAADEVVAHRMSQSKSTMSAVICDALTAPHFHLEGEARTAADELKRDFPLDSDAEVITLAVRWLGWHVRQHRIETLEFGE